MLKRHSDELDNRLDAVKALGCVQIMWWELYSWYDAQRITKSIWRDIRSRLDDIGIEDASIFQNGIGIIISNDNAEWITLRDKIGDSEE